MRARFRIRFAAFLLAFGSLAAAPAHAVDRCLSNGICWSSERLDWRKSQLHITLKGGNRIGNYVPLHYNIRTGGTGQFEVPVARGFRGLAVAPGTLVSVQACRKRITKSICTDWASFKPY